MLYPDAQVTAMHAEPRGEGRALVQTRIVSARGTFVESFHLRTGSYGWVIASRDEVGVPPGLAPPAPRALVEPRRPPSGALAPAAQDPRAQP
jgi:hypothetical protein